MIDRGSIVLVDLEPVLGHEQGGYRPCIVVSPRTIVAAQRFYVLVDQVRAIAKVRIRAEMAPVPPPDMSRVDDALRQALGL